MAAVCRRAWGWPVRLLVSIKGFFWLVFLWLILAAECAGDAPADGAEGDGSGDKYLEKCSWKGIGVLLSTAHTTELQYLGAGGNEGHTGEVPQIHLERSFSPSRLLRHIVFLLWRAVTPRAQF